MTAADADPNKQQAELCIHVHGQRMLMYISKLSKGTFQSSA
jgi:hypothetical protein